MKVERRFRSKSASQLLAAELAEAEFALKEKLVAAREAAGLRQVDVAEKLGVDKSTISRFERLDSNPTLSMLRYYAHAIGALVTHDVKLVNRPVPVSCSGEVDLWQSQVNVVVTGKLVAASSVQKPRRSRILNVPAALTTANTSAGMV